MIGKTEAIVLNKVKYGDNSFIVNFYSLDFGRFAAIIRIPKTSTTGIKPAVLSPLNIVETEVKMKDSRNIQSVKYCNRNANLDNLSTDIFKSCIAQFIAEILVKTIKEEEANPQLFSLIKKTILLLNDTSKNISDIHLYFLRDFAVVSGFGITDNFVEETAFFNIREGMFLPMFTSSEESLDVIESKILSDFLKSTYDNESSFTNFKTRKMLIDKLLQYYKMHIHGFGEIKSLKILQEVFND